MWTARLVSALAALGLLCSVGGECPAQQVTVGTPFNSVGDSFFENFGTSWNFNWKGLHASFGGSPVNAAPQFGGFDPSAGLNTGFHVNRNGFNGSLNLNASHGFRRSFVSQVPSVTMMNGQSAFFSDTSVSPFVISFIPVVGGFPTVASLNPFIPPVPYSMAGSDQGPGPGNPRVQAMQRKLAQGEQNAGAPAPQAARPKARNEAGDLDLAAPAPQDKAAGKLAAAQSSSAGRAVPSVAEARRLHAQEQAAADNEAMALYQRARTAEELGKANVALIYYRMVARRATGDLKQQALSRLAVLESGASR